MMPSHLQMYPTFVGPTPDVQAMEQRDIDLEELLTPVELRDIDELLMPEIDGGAHILLACAL